MDVGVLGVNYKSSDLGQRELFAKTVQEFLKTTKLTSFVLLATCNRTEIYFSAPDLVHMHCQLLLELKQIGQPAEDKMYYGYFGKHCFLHLAKVVSGTDSVIFGETEIQGQVKRAYQQACQENTLPSPLHYLFQKSLKVGKEIRSLFRLPKENCSLELALWELMQCFAPLKRKLRVLFIGYSEINRKVISFCKAKEDVALFLITRNQAAKEEISSKQGVTLVPWEKIASWSTYDVVIAGSKSLDHLLTLDQIPLDTSSIGSRLVIDLGLPRNVDPLVGKHPLITLFNIKEIGEFIEQKKGLSLDEEALIQESIERRISAHASLYIQKSRQALLYV